MDGELAIGEASSGEEPAIKQEMERGSQTPEAQPGPHASENGVDGPAADSNASPPLPAGDTAITNGTPSPHVAMPDRPSTLAAAEIKGEYEYGEAELSTPTASTMQATPSEFGHRLTLTLPTDSRSSAEPTPIAHYHSPEPEESTAVEATPGIPMEQQEEELLLAMSPVTAAVEREIEEMEDITMKQSPEATGDASGVELAGLDPDAAEGRGSPHSTSIQLIVPTAPPNTARFDSQTTTGKQHFILNQQQTPSSQIQSSLPIFTSTWPGNRSSRQWRTLSSTGWRSLG
jgi:hypothetical protein